MSVRYASRRTGQEMPTSGCDIVATPHSSLSTHAYRVYRTTKNRFTAEENATGSLTGPFDCSVVHQVFSPPRDTLGAEKALVG